MIDFRYHVVTLVGVFLALGLGLLLGATMLSGPLTERFESDLRRAREARNEAQARADELESEIGAFEDLVENEIAPWLISGRLEGHNVLFVLDGQTNRWRDEVRDVLLRSGARPVGNLVLTEKWLLDREGAAEELQAVMERIVPAYEPGPDAALSALDLLGRRLPEPTGQALVGALVEGGFAVAEGREGEEPWPPSDAIVVGLASAYEDDDVPQPTWLATFARGAAEATTALVVAGDPADRSAVRVLRDGEETPRRLSTFDAGASDISGIGVVAALEVALAERGGNFGRERERRYIPTPA